MSFKRFYQKITRLGFLSEKPHEEFAQSRLGIFNYRLIWLAVVITTNLVALVPLVAITVVNYETTESAIDNEFQLRTARVVSNTYRSLKFLLTERQSALHFAAVNTSADVLNKPERIKDLLQNLRESFGGGFEDIGVISASGTQISYIGPYELMGKNYYGQPWFDKVTQEGSYVSDVFLGFRQKPHLVIAVKKSLASGTFEILRTTMSIDLFERLLADVQLGGRGEAFIVNSSGILQTNTRYYGLVLDKCKLPVPEYSSSTRVIEYADYDGEPLYMGYRYIENTPFILMVVKAKRELMKSWLQNQQKLVFFLFASICAILLVTMASATTLVHKIYEADQQRALSFQQIGHNEKMASIGRLAANVSHEINNPLAIINEKAGLIKDMFEIKKIYSNDPKLISSLDSILAAVQRGSKITRRLLSFARNMEASNEVIDLEKLIREVLVFLEKEAEFKSIDIRLSTGENIPPIESDRGKLQQIFVNIINNAFDAMEKKGVLAIGIGKVSDTDVFVKVTDDGRGISEQNLQQIFEPFFSTKTARGGTGLGLVVTYNLVKEIGGCISVDSKEGKGTSFTLTIPLKQKKEVNSRHARITG